MMDIISAAIENILKRKDFNDLCKIAALSYLEEIRGNHRASLAYEGALTACLKEKGEK